MHYQRSGPIRRNSGFVTDNTLRISRRRSNLDIWPRTSYSTTCWFRSVKCRMGLWGNAHLLLAVKQLLLRMCSVTVDSDCQNILIPLYGPVPIVLRRCFFVAVLDYPFTNQFAKAELKSSSLEAKSRKGGAEYFRRAEKRQLTFECRSELNRHNDHYQRESR